MTMKNILKAFSQLLAAALLAAGISSCLSAEEKALLFEEGNVVTFTVSADAMVPGTKSTFAGNENYIKTVQVLVYDAAGNYYSGRYFSDYPSGMKFSLRDDGTYTFLLLCNCPEIPEASIPATLTAARTYDVNISSKVVAYGLYPDGLPMAGEDSFSVTDDMSYTFNVRRMVSKWSIRYANPDADEFAFSVSSVKLKNCPVDFQPWTDWAHGSWSSPVSACVDGDWAIPADLAAMSGDLTLDGTNYAYFYVLENCQGVQAGITDYSQRNPDNITGGIADKCTYAEVALNCSELSDWHRATGSESALGDVVYRVYLGRNDTNDFNIYRNTSNTLLISDNAGSVAFDIEYGSNDTWQAEYNIVPTDSHGQTSIWFKYPSYTLSTVDNLSVVNPATVSPLQGRTVTYTSDDDGICTVSADGTITATGVGTTTVRASVPAVTVGSTVWGSASASCTITVGSSQSATLSIVPETWIGPWGETFTIAATKNPSDGDIVWESSDPSVATVNPATGEVTTVHPGECIITATLTAAGKTPATAFCRLTVLKQQANLTFTPSSFVQKASDVTFGVTPNINTTVSSNSNAPIRWKGGMFYRIVGGDRYYCLRIQFPDYSGLGGYSANIPYGSTLPATWEWPAIDSGTTYAVNISAGNEVPSQTVNFVVEQDENEYYYAGQASLSWTSTTPSGSLLVDYTTPNNVFTFADYPCQYLWPTNYFVNVLIPGWILNQPDTVPITVSGIPAYFNQLRSLKTDNTVKAYSSGGSITSGNLGNDYWINYEAGIGQNEIDLKVSCGYDDPMSACDRMRSIMTNSMDIHNGIIEHEVVNGVHVYKRQFTITSSCTVQGTNYIGSETITMVFMTKG